MSANGNPTYTTDYVLDGNNVVQESVTTAGNVNPVIAATYLMGPSGPMYKRPANSADVRWYLYDGGGNVTGEVDPLGNVTASEKHDVYGAMRGGSGTATSKHGWQGGVGHQSDGETGLVYMRARYYAPELGRFQSEDPGRDGNNWFIYCNDDPIGFSDSNGKEPKIISGPGYSFTIHDAPLNAFCFLLGYAFTVASMCALISGARAIAYSLGFAACVFFARSMTGLEDFATDSCLGNGALYEALVIRALELAEKAGRLQGIVGGVAGTMMVMNTFAVIGAFIASSEIE